MGVTSGSNSRQLERVCLGWAGRALAWSSNVKSRHGSDHEDEDHTPARESTQGVLFPARVAHALGTAPEGLQELCVGSRVSGPLSLLL